MLLVVLFWVFVGVSLQSQPVFAANEQRSQGNLEALLADNSYAQEADGQYKAPDLDNTNADIIKHIAVEGLMRVPPETVRIYLVAREGMLFDRNLIISTSKLLYETGFFAEVSVLREGQTLIVRVVENPVVSNIKFQGNDLQFSDEKLVDIVEILPKMFISNQKIRDAERKLNLHYVQSGYQGASVKYELEHLDRNQVNIIFQVNPGNRMKIAKLEFFGNQTYSDKCLLFESLDPFSREVWWLGLNIPYKPTFLQMLELGINEYYKGNGFVDVRVQLENEYLSEGQGHEIVVKTSVAEGKRYKFGTFELNAPLSFSNFDDFATLMKPKFSNWYREATVQEVRKEIVEELQKRGEPFYDVVVYRKKALQDKIDVTMRIVDRPNLYFGFINIYGNVRTVDDVIRRQLTAIEADPLSAYELEESLKNIKQLGFFSKVIYIPSHTREGFVDIDIIVDEHSTGHVSFGIGYSKMFGPMIDVIALDSNALGKEQGIDFELILGRTGVKFRALLTALLKEDELTNGKYGIALKVTSLTGGESVVQTYQENKLELYWGSYQFAAPVYAIVLLSYYMILYSERNNIVRYRSKQKIARRALYFFVVVELVSYSTPVLANAVTAILFPDPCAIIEVK